MSGQLLASKVVVVEEEPKVRGIPGLPTAVAGMVGITERGPIDRAVLCSSFEEFQDRFYASFRGDVGAGLRTRLNRHQFVQMSFLYAIHDVVRELIGTEPENEDDVDIRHIGGEAWTRSFWIGWGWDF